MLVVERRGECWQDSLVLVEVFVPTAVTMSVFAQDRGPLDPIQPCIPRNPKQAKQRSMTYFGDAEHL